MSRRRSLVRYVEVDSEDDQSSSPYTVRYRTRSARGTPSPDVDRENRMIPARYSLRKRKHVFVSTDIPMQRPRTRRYPLRHSLPTRVTSPSPPIQMETEDSDTGIVIRLSKAGSEGTWILGKQAQHQLDKDTEEEEEEDAEQVEEEDVNLEEQAEDLGNQVEEKQEEDGDVEELEHPTEEHKREQAEEEEEAFEPTSAESECSEDEGGASVEEDLIELSSGLESGRRYSLRRRNGAIPKAVSSRYPIRERRRSSSLHSFQLPDSIAQKNSRPARRRNINRVQGDQLLPINWGETPDPEAGDSDSDLNNKDGSKLLADITPIAVDTSIDWNDVGGLDSHIRSLKEMVILPLLYPEFFEKFGVQAPRGVLFYGPPGTGKTLTARALAACCSSTGKKVSFFMRKGADVLNKWVGESERQLRLLFEEATRLQPSVIFFDEIDGLAPVRSSRQDHIHSSIVSTMLALMDGLTSRGQVIVIGATNRIDSIDPALRRPGRFDRELGFSLPSKSGRKSILKIHTKSWDPPMIEAELDQLADRTNGYSGADLRSLCTEASLAAVKRVYPEIYSSTKKLHIDISSIQVESADFGHALQRVTPTSARVSSIKKCCLPKEMSVLIENNLSKSLEHQNSLLNPSTTELHKPRLLILGEAGIGQSYVAHSLLNHLDDFGVFSLDLPSLVADPLCRSSEEACARVLQQAADSTKALLFWPHVELWWECASEPMRALLKGFLESGRGVYLLAFCDYTLSIEDLPEELRDWFDHSVATCCVLDKISSAQRLQFFHCLVQDYLKKPEQQSKNCKLKKVVLEPPAVSKAIIKEPAEDVSEGDHKCLLKMRLRLRGLCCRLMSEFKFFKEAPNVDVIEELGLGLYSTVNEHPIFLKDVLDLINQKKCRTPSEFLHLIDQMVEQTSVYYRSSNTVCINIVNQACQLQDIALSTVYTYPKDLVQKCDQMLHHAPVPRPTLDTPEPVPTVSESSEMVEMDVEDEDEVQIEHAGESAFSDAEIVEALDVLFGRLESISEGFSIDQLFSLLQRTRCMLRAHRVTSVADIQEAAEAVCKLIQ